MVVDLETTGLDLKRDAIASYGAVVIRHGRIVVAENTYGLVCPNCEITVESTTVHTLRRADVADAPPLSQAVPVLDAVVGDRVQVKHGVADRILIPHPQHPHIHFLGQVLGIGLGADASPEERLQGASVLGDQPLHQSGFQISD